MNIEKGMIYADTSIPCIALTPASLIGNALISMDMEGVKKSCLGWLIV